jgi:hypothetical protein
VRRGPPIELSPIATAARHTPARRCTMKSSPVMLTAALVLCLSGSALVQVAAASQTCARPTTSRRPRPPRRTCARPTASRRPRTPWRLPRRPRTSRCPRRRSQHVPDRPDLVRTCGRTRGRSLRGEAPVARPCRAPHGVSLGSRRRPPAAAPCAATGDPLPLMRENRSPDRAHRPSNRPRCDRQLRSPAPGLAGLRSTDAATSSVAASTTRLRKQGVSGSLLSASHPA